MYNNRHLAERSHMLFICVLPSQLQGVIEEICNHLNKQSIVYCLVNNTTAKKVKRTLDYSNIILPKFVFNASTILSWKNCMSIHDALEDGETIKKCCPYAEEGRGM